MPLCIGQRCVQAAASTSSRVGAPVPTLRSNRAARSVRVGLTGGAAGEKALFGEDFGARDPYAAEIESNFGEKVLGNYNTDHIIKPPEAIGKVLGLAARSLPAASELVVLDASTRERLRQQVPGWRVVAAGADAAAAIQQDWTVKDADSAQRLVDSIGEISRSLGHAPASLEAVGGTTVVARLATEALGGLTEADFILAAKINALDISDLLPKRKQRFWA